MSRTTSILLTIALSATAILMPFLYWERGLIEVESTTFVQQYLDDRGMLQKVFDPHRNDLNTYQARELSYFIDYLDARWLEVLLRGGHDIFMPLSAICASVLTVVVFLAGVRRYGMRPLIAALLLLMYLTNYVHVVTMGMLYRSAKPMLAPVVIGTAFYLAALVQNSSRETLAGSGRTGWAPVVVFALFCIMSLLDRQGFFLALTGFTVLLLNAVFAGGRRDVVAGGAAAMVAMVFYNLIGAPFIIESLNGYRPSFEYQQIPLNRLADPRSWLAAGWLLLHAASVLLGGMPIWVVAGLVLALGSWAVLPRSGVPRIATLLFAAVALGQFVMFAGMVARHPFIYTYVDHRLWYYALPFQALVLVGIVVALDLGGSEWSRTRAASLNLAIAAAVLANVAHWNGYRAAQLRSRWFPTVYEQTAALKSSLAGTHPLWYLTPEYLGLYQFTLLVSPVFRAGADAKPAGDAP